MMKLRLQWVFVWLGLAMMAALLCLHLYLHEKREVGQVSREFGRLERLKETGGQWGAPVVMREGKEYEGMEVALRRLNSVGRDTLSADSKKHDDVMSERERVRVHGMRSEMRAERQHVADVREFTDHYSENLEKGERNEEEEEEFEAEKEGDMGDDVMENMEDLIVGNYGGGVVEEQWNQSDLSTSSKTHFRNQSDQFSLRSSFSLPTPEATLPLRQLLQCEWMREIKDHLRSLTSSSRLVSIVSSDYKYREVLLNWLLTAQVKVRRPLSNVLVLSLDESLHQLLREKKIPCVHIPTSCLLRPSLKLTRHVVFTQVHIMRVLVMRLLNHWGYDVANYDSDALILRNPEPCYEELADRHLIGSVGHFPKEMDHKWGTAVCIGVVMIRASPQTELYWEAMSTVIPATTNDQARLNWALDAMTMVWDNPKSDMSVHTMTGEGSDGFRAAVLPVRDVCRQTCTKKMIRVYYIWHKGGAQNRNGKMSYASKGGLWYLHGNWEQISRRTGSTGREWLAEIAR